MKTLLHIAVLLLGACAQIPVLQPMDASQQALAAQVCQSHFSKGSWQLVYTIDVRLKSGRQATLTGFVVLSPEDDSIECALMMPDGFVVFEAVDRGWLAIRRAFGPFANENFAQGVMEDIRFLFVAPEELVAAGRFENGLSGCRYRAKRHRTVDLIEQTDGGWQLRQYDRLGNPLRAMAAEAPDPDGFSHRMVLSADARRPYQLTMTLDEAVRIE